MVTQFENTMQAEEVEERLPEDDGRIGFSIGIMAYN